MVGMDPRQMRRMMQQMGINSKEINAKKVIIETDDSDIIIENPNVTEINAQGQISYQISGNVKEEISIKEDDIKMVMDQTGVSREKALEALKEKEGDLAEAILSLQTEK